MPSTNASYEHLTAMASLTSFQKRVYAATLCVPPGQVTTYGDIARFVSSDSNTKHARAVGNALKRNPFAPGVPCHRVIRADLTLGGFFGQTATTSGACKRKVRMLADEGVTFDASCGQVSDRASVFDFAGVSKDVMKEAVAKVDKLSRQAPHAASEAHIR